MPANKMLTQADMDRALQRTDIRQMLERAQTGVSAMLSGDDRQAVREWADEKYPQLQMIGKIPRGESKQKWIRFMLRYVGGLKPNVRDRLLTKIKNQYA